MTRSEAEIGRIYAGKDEHERDQQIMYQLPYATSCEEITETERELDFCRRMAPGVRALVARGIGIDLSDPDDLRASRR